jgi:hypothetical protein
MVERKRRVWKLMIRTIDHTGKIPADLCIRNSSTPKWQTHCPDIGKLGLRRYEQNS